MPPALAAPDNILPALLLPPDKKLRPFPPTFIASLEAFARLLKPVELELLT